MLNRSFKVALYLVFLLALFLLHTQTTDADLVAQRIVRNNSLTATTLSLSPRNSANWDKTNWLFSVQGIRPEGFDVRALKIYADSGSSFNYAVRTVNIAGDIAFCQRLDVRVLKKSAQVFAGKLGSLSLQDAIPSSGKIDYIFFLELNDPDSSLKSKQCSFDFVVKTWKNNPDEEQKGIFARQVVQNTVSSGAWK